MPLFDGKTGNNDQRLPVGKALKQDKRPWDRALTWPGQPPCPLLRSKRATMTSVCRREKPQDKTSGRKTERWRGLSSLHAQFWGQHGLPLCY